MNKFFLLVFIQLFTISLTAQDKEKLLANQSQLIDAIKEEQIGNKEKAIEILDKLKHEADTRGISYYFLSRIYKSLGKMEESFEAIEQSIIAEPENPWYLQVKAKMTEEYGRNLETAISYEKLSKLEPDVFTHYDNAAFFYLKAEDFKTALEILNKAERNFGLMPSLAIKKSYVLNFLKKNKNAIEVLEACNSQFPTNKEVLMELIKSHTEIRNLTAAAKYIEKLKAIDPKNEHISQWLNDHEKTANREKEPSAEEMIKSAHVNLDDKVKLLFVKLNAFKTNADHTGIKTLLPLAEQLRTQYPDEAKTAALLGDIYFQLNNLVAAKNNYVESIRNGQVPYSVWDNLLFCLIQLNHWQTALFVSEKSIDLYPNQSFPNYVQILSKYKLNKFDNIISTIELLELMVSHNEHKKTEVLVLKAKILSDMKKEKESMDVWKLALETDHDYLAPLEYCVFMASNKKEYPKEYFDKAMQSQYLHESFKLNKAAELFYFKNDFVTAKEFIESSIAKEYLESYDNLILAAKIYTANGDAQKASEFTTKASSLKNSESFEQLKQSMIHK